MPLDEQDKQTIAAMIAEQFKGDTLKGVIAEALKPVTAEVGKQIDAKLKAEREAQGKALDERLKDLKPADGSQGGAGTGGAVQGGAQAGQGGQAGHGGSAVSPEVARELEKLRTQNEVIQRQLKETEDARKTAEEARRTEALLGEFRRVAAEQGIPQDRIRHAEAVLYHADRRVTYGAGGDDSKPGLLFKKPYGDVIEPLADGLKEWLKSDEGKAFLPPRDVNGTGQGGGQKPATAPRVNGGGLDWAALRGRVAAGAIRALSDGPADT